MHKTLHFDMTIMIVVLSKNICVLVWSVLLGFSARGKYDNIIKVEGMRKYCVSALTS